MPSFTQGPSHASSCNRQSISDITQHVAEQITVILPCRDTCKRGTGNQKNFKLCTVSHNSVHISSGNLKHLSFNHTKQLIFHKVLAIYRNIDCNESMTSCLRKRKAMKLIPMSEKVRLKNVTFQQTFSVTHKKKIVSLTTLQQHIHDTSQNSFDSAQTFGCTSQSTWTGHLMKLTDLTANQCLQQRDCTCPVYFYSPKLTEEAVFIMFSLQYALWSQRIFFFEKELRK